VGCILFAMMARCNMLMMTSPGPQLVPERHRL
jgi:hypothetical protein